MLSERLAWLEYQNNIIDFYSQLQQLEQTAITAENWLKAQPTPATDPATVKIQLERCKVRDSSSGSFFNDIALHRCSKGGTDHDPHYFSIKMVNGLLGFTKQLLKIFVQGKERLVKK